MAIASGLDAQFGLALESTYGTAVTPSQFYEFLSESLALSIERQESEGLRPQRRVTTRDQWLPGRRGVEGDVSMEWPDRGASILARLMLGGASSTTTPSGATTAREHAVQVGVLDGLSATVQVGRPDVQGVVRPFTYPGAKVTEWEISNEVDGFLMASLSLDAQDEATDTALAVASYVANSKPLNWVGGVVTIGGVEYEVRDFSVAGSNGLRTDRYFLRSGGAEVKREPLETNLREFTGEISADFDGLTLYDLYRQGTVAEIRAKWEGEEIEPGYRFGLEVVLPAVRFDGSTPNVGGPEEIVQSVSYKVLDNLADPAVQFILTDDQGS